MKTDIDYLICHGISSTYIPQSRSEDPEHVSVKLTV